VAVPGKIDRVDGERSREKRSQLPEVLELGADRVQEYERWTFA
jgi:hypothetical protein